LKSLSAESLKDYLGSKDYGLEQNVKGLETSLKNFNLADIEIKDGKLFQMGVEI